MPSSRLKVLAAGLTLGASVSLSAQPTAPPRGPQESYAFVGVHVVPMTRDTVLRDQTVLVRDGRIERIGPRANTPVPSDRVVIAGNGRYLMPGLADMHVHLSPWDSTTEPRARQVLGLLLANGVTTVRSMVGHASHLAMRSAERSGAVLAPRLVVAAPQMTGPNATGYFAQFKAATPEEASRRVDEYAAAGYDLIKVTFGLTPAVYDAITSTAKRAGVRVSGHVQPPVGLDRALMAGQQIEHLDTYLDAAARDDAPARTTVVQGAPGDVLRHIDWDKLPGIAALTVRSGVVNTPTLALFQVAFIRPLPMDSLLALPGVEYLTPAARAAHEQNLRAFWDTPRDPVLLSTMDEFRNRMTKALADAGASLLVGSDSPNALFMPGFSIHRELRALHQAGLTPYQVLRAATVSAASYLGLEREFGTVAPGVGADLLLLSGNPLSGLAALERPDGVMTRGRWLARETLDTMLQRAKP